MLFLFRSIAEESDNIRSINRPKVILGFRQRKKLDGRSEKEKALQAIEQRKKKALDTEFTGKGD